LFKGAQDRLARDGRMLITFAEFGDIDFFETTATAQNFTLSIIDSASSSDQQRKYILYELAHAKM
jgi:hypothetical protein